MFWDRFARAFFALMLCASIGAVSYSQTATTFTAGQVLPAASLNTAFAGKVDYPCILCVGTSSNGQVLLNTSGAVVGDTSLTYASPALTLGLAGSTTGQLKLTGSGSGTITIQAQANAGTYTEILPNSAGLNGQFKQSQGPGQPEIWANAAGTGTVNSGTAGNMTYYASSTNAVSPNTNANISAGALTLGVAASVQGSLILAGATGGQTTIQAVGTGGGTVVLPASGNVVTDSASQNLTNKTYNKVTITAPATGSTLTLADGKTLTVNNTMTFAGVDSKTNTFNNSITWAGTDSTTMTFPASNGTIAALNIADQTVTGGANVTSQSQSTGNISLDCGTRPLQYALNNGAIQITAPASDGSCIFVLFNVTGAQTPTYLNFGGKTPKGDTFAVGSGGTTFNNVTITNASPGVVSWTSHGLGATTAVYFTTVGGGVLPGQLAANTIFYVCSGATLLTNSFAVATTRANALAGTCVTTSGGSGTVSAFQASVFGLSVAEVNGVAVGAWTQMQ